MNSNRKPHKATQRPIANLPIILIAYCVLFYQSQTAKRFGLALTVTIAPLLLAAYNGSSNNTTHVVTSTPIASSACEYTCDVAISDDLIRRAIGHAEGTLTVTGEETWAYNGHTDPGNQVWNRGAFSYQHEANSPQDADQKQLARLRRQEQQLRQQAAALNLTLSREEWLNALDLANQAPAAALESGGYMDRLAESRHLFTDQQKAITWARTWSYWDLNLQAWNAPGLGNTELSIWADQARRQKAIAMVVLHE
jgi:hypothetical protein